MVLGSIKQILIHDMQFFNGCQYRLLYQFIIFYIFQNFYDK